MAPTLLLVVFAADDGKENPAAAAVRAAAARWDETSRDLHLEVLEVPRAYERAGEAVRQALVRHRPELFLLYDTDPTSEEYKLHHLAANYDDSERSDADGEVRQDHIIDTDGPVAFRTHLPLDGVWDKLLVERVPVRMSHKATHVFNHVYYRALQTIHDEGLNTRGGAIEAPPTAAVAEADDVARVPEALEEEAIMVFAVLRQLYPAMVDG